MKYLMGVDEGTTGCKAILFDQEGHQIATTGREYPSYYPHPDFVVHLMIAAVHFSCRCTLFWPSQYIASLLFPVLRFRSLHRTGISSQRRSCLPGPGLLQTSWMLSPFGNPRNMNGSEKNGFPSSLISARGFPSKSPKLISLILSSVVIST